MAMTNTHNTNNTNTINPNLTASSLYVGDLAPEVTEAVLFDVFCSVGPVASIRVCRDSITHASLCYGYVNYHSSADAERALNTINNTTIKDKVCRIMWSHRDPSLRKSGLGNVFVKHLDETVDNKTLYDTFSTFGNILSCKVARDSKGNSLRYGFVHFETVEAANDTIENVNGTPMGSQKIYAAHFKPRSQREGPNRTNFTNIYVKDFPEDTTEDKFKEIFGKFGKITSVCFPLDDEGKPKGFGFINFESPKSAKQAIEELHDKEPLKLYVCRAKTKEERSKELRDQYEDIRTKQAEKYAGLNLYIKNLDDNADDESLRKDFGKFGEITSAKIMRDSAQCSKGFGFVCFKNREDAATALSKMNGMMYMNKPLYVAMAQTRAVRHRQLQAQIQANNAKSLQHVGATPGGPGMQPNQMFPPVTPMLYSAAQQQSNPLQRSNQNFMYPPGVSPQVMPSRWNPRQMQQAGQMMPNMYMMPQHQQFMSPQQMRPLQNPMSAPGGPDLFGAYQRMPNKPPMANKPPMINRQNTRTKFNNSPNYREQKPGAANAPYNLSTGLTPGSTQKQAQKSKNMMQGFASLPEEKQKEMLGNRLYDIVYKQHPSHAPRITGMLVEMETADLINLLENNVALTSKVNEALELILASDGAD